ncbi:MAG TPA: DNA mismatch repair endonuclease MutL [Dehalococcoidia bacterium]|nr:DNA mismatch repair endonuclease MutL [Dehalococcoidia bacterium]
MPIRVLPPEVASRIAAGEVIERPASIVKELVENALDAGATRIAVEANEGGVALIRVVDDGCGVEPNELPLAFQRHATSKLVDDADIEAVVTLGFRGEALPSIAAVSEVEAISAPEGASKAARVRLRYGQLTDQGASGAPQGTSITVRNLFREQPARLKFLRTPGAEASQIASVVSHYALAYPEVAFSLRIDGRETFSTSGSGDWREAVAGVYGSAVGAALIEAEEADETHHLRALLAPPSLSRATRNYVTIFINRRWVRSRSLVYAVEEAYAGLLPTGRFPLAVVDLRLPPSEVDVNVHPAKAEVRLRDERRVFTLVQRPLRRALQSLAPATSFVQGGWATGGPSSVRITQYPEAPPSLRLETMPVQSMLQPHAATPEPMGEQTPLPGAMPLLRPLGQAGTTYVIAEGPAGLYLIDQHAAHERILYERFLAREHQPKQESQPLLVPVVLELTPSQQALVTSLAPALSAHGFEIEPFGPGGYLLRAAPAGLRRDDPARAFGALLDLLTREDAPADPHHRVAASLACHAAVRAGQTLAVEEMRDLIQQLEACELPQTCPHGRPTMLHLSADELAKRFGRK